MRGHGSQWISHKINIRHPIEKMKILGAVVELPAKQHYQSSEIMKILGAVL